MPLVRHTITQVCLWLITKENSCFYLGFIVCVVQYFSSYYFYHKKYYFYAISFLCFACQTVNSISKHLSRVLLYLLDKMLQNI